MGYHYGYGGLLFPDGEDELRANWLNAKKRLEEFKKALSAPIGSFAWEDAVHSGVTIEALEEKVRQAKDAYFNGT